MAVNLRRPSISTSFIENFDFLKRFLTRYFSERQDIEDVVQETYLRAYGAEQKKVIEHPRAFLFQIAKNLALTELKKSPDRFTITLMITICPWPLARMTLCREKLRQSRISDSTVKP